MNRYRYVFLFLLYFLTSGMLQGASPFFPVKLESAQPVQMLPRSKATVIISVENRRTEQLRFTLVPHFPADWKQITPLSPLEIPGGETDVFLLTFFAPQGTLSGSYQVDYSIRDNYGNTNEGSIPVEILPEKLFEMKLIGKPEYVIAGKEYAVSYLLYNTGNTGIRLALSVKSSDGFAYNIAGDGVIRQSAVAENEPHAGILPREVPVEYEATLVLAPGAGINIVVSVKTAGSVNRVISHRLSFTTGLLEEEASGEKLQPGRSSTTYVDVIPEVSGVREMYHRLPLDLRYSTSQGYSGQYKGDLGVHLQSKGTLDEERNHHIELEIHKWLDLAAPDLFHKSDQFTFEYWSDHWKLAAGDRGYSLSPLTENFGYGRGIEADYYFGRFGVGAYYQQNIWTESLPGHAGAFFNYRVDNDLFPGGYQYLAAINGFSKINEGITLGLYQDYKPVKSINIEAEAVAGTRFGNDLSFAGLIRADGDHKWITYNLAGIYADPLYPGYYSNLNLLSGNLGLRLFSGSLKVYGGYVYENHNNLNDPAQISAALNNTAHGGIDYLLALSKTEFSFLWKNNNRYDRLPVPDFHYNENIFRLQIIQPLPMVKIYSSAEVNIYDDILNQLSVYSQDYLLGMEYTPAPSSLFNFFLGYNWRLDTGDFLQQKFSWGIVSSLFFSDLLLDFQLKNNLNITGAEAAGLDFIFVIGTGYRFRDLTKLTANLNYALINRASDWDNNFSLSIEYTTPFQMPLAKKKNIGSVKGHVYDMLTAAPLSGVIFRIGGFSAVTDEKGNFVFPALDPGEYYINLNLDSLKESLIPDRNMPARIQVESGQTSVLDIGLTRAVTIKGNLALYDFKNQSAGFNLAGTDNNGNNDEEYVFKPASGFIVEITNGIDIKRRITDKNGNFIFEELAPGDWNLKVLNYGLPRYHYIEKDNFEVHLLAGDTHSFEIRILPEKRSVMLIEDGGTLTAE